MVDTAPIPTTSAHHVYGIELAKAYFCDPTDKEAREKLADYCLRAIENLSRAFVFGRGLYPRSYGPDMSFEECISASSEKYTLGIDSLRSPENLHAWLRRMVRRALIDLFWHVRGQQKEEREMVPFGKTVVRDEGEGEEVEVVADKETRDAAFRHLPASLLLMVDGDMFAEKIENQELLRKALEEHAEDNPESASWVATTWEDPALTVESIAQTRACSVRTVFRLLRHDNGELIRIARKMIGKDMPGQAA
jgi:DNA-directed RNA polymerase specialized sigma24 family protein